MRYYFCFFLIVLTTNIKSQDSISIIGVGDIMLGTDYPSSQYLPPHNDCTGQLNDVCKFLSNADITFGNLEGTLAGEIGIPKYCRDTTKCYVFRMPQSYIECLITCGFDIVSTANNHSNDFGEKGRYETMKVLDSTEIKYAGYLEKPFIIFNNDSITYGFSAFAPNKGTNDSKDYNNVKNIINYLDSLCDIVIISIHTGAEGAKHEHLPKTDEIYLGYNRGNIYEFAHLAIDNGADVIFGHGPHVTRAVELYKNRLIAYSLGNFSTYARFNLKGPNGISPILKVFLNKKTGEFLNAEIIPVCQTGEGITIFDSQKRVIYKIIELTNSDFPDSKLLINEEGKIIQKD